MAILNDKANAANPFDAMVVDGKMPGMDGPEAIRQARRSPVHQSAADRTNVRP